MTQSIVDCLMGASNKLLVLFCVSTFCLVSIFEVFSRRPRAFEGFIDAWLDRIDEGDSRSIVAQGDTLHAAS